MFGPVFKFDNVKLWEECEKINPEFKNLSTLDEQKETIMKVTGWTEAEFAERRASLTVTCFIG
jgi:hypothetical protein